MTYERTNPERPPAAEQLAAYVDGELAPAERLNLENWLDGHPDAAAAVATWRRLGKLMQTSVAPEPAPESWAGCRRHVEGGLAAARRRARPVLGLVLALAAAAALLIALLPREEPFPVAT